MLLVSKAVDRALGQIDFTVLRGKTVYFDPQYIEAAPDKGYLVSSLRQSLLAHGCYLQEEKSQAEYVVEARSGALGTDRYSLLVGIPQMNIPVTVPGAPSFIPEIPFAKKNDQEGVAKVAVYAYHRKTGKAVWQSGTLEASAQARDTWIAGTGPFRRGSIVRETQFVGVPLPVKGEEGKDDPRPGVVPVTNELVFADPDCPGKLPTDVVRSPLLDANGELVPTVAITAGSAARSLKLATAIAPR
jgi:hypothetical protein